MDLLSTGRLRAHGPHRGLISSFSSRGDGPGSLSDRDLADRVRGELRPSGIVETFLVDRIVASTRFLMSDTAQGEPPSREARRAEGSLRACLESLRLVKDLAAAPATDPATALGRAPSDPGPEDWRGRLAFDRDVSEDSPVVRGTWVTVEQVISRIVDGWSWDDLLRTHPELTVEDIRACLSFQIERPRGIEARTERP